MDSNPLGKSKPIIKTEIVVVLGITLYKWLTSEKVLVRVANQTISGK